MTTRANNRKLADGSSALAAKAFDGRPLSRLARWITSSSASIFAAMAFRKLAVAEAGSDRICSNADSASFAARSTSASVASWNAGSSGWDVAGLTAVKVVGAAGGLGSD